MEQLEQILQPGAVQRRPAAIGGRHPEQGAGIEVAREEITRRLRTEVVAAAERHETQIHYPAKVTGMKPVPVEEPAVVPHLPVGVEREPA
jgi:hypothetical protein